MDTSTHSSFDMWFLPGPVSWHNLSTLFALFCCSLSVCSALSILKFRLIFAQHPSKRESWKMRACCGWKLALQTVCFISQYWTRLTSSSFLCVCVRQSRFIQRAQPLPFCLCRRCCYADTPNFQLLSISAAFFSSSCSLWVARFSPASLKALKTPGQNVL